MTTVEKLSIKSRITAVFPDGARRSNIGVGAAASLLDGNERVLVEVEETESAKAVLKRLVDKSGYHIISIPEGTFLSQAESAGAVLAFEDGVKGTRGGLISLGAKEVFTSVDAAMAFIFKWDFEEHPDLPDRYHQELTQTFTRGGPEGQIKSIFQDMRRYGPRAVLGKIRNFRAYVKVSSAPVYRKYKAFMGHNLLPHHRETQAQTADGTRVDMSYFKLFAILKVAEHFDRVLPPEPAAPVPEVVAEPA